MTEDPTTPIPKGIDWRAIMIAVAVLIIGCVAVVLLWFVLGMILLAVAGERGLDAVSQSVLGHALGKVLLLMPVLAGAWKLSTIVGRQVDAAREHEGQRDTYRHCLVFGLVTLALVGLPAIMSGDVNLSWKTTPYYVAVIPTALLGGFIRTRIRRG